MGHADTQAAAQLLRGAPNAAKAVIDLRERDLDLAEQSLACFGDDDALADAVKQPMADLGLELLDLVRQRRLGDVNGLRRAGEIEMFGECREITQMTQFHGPCTPLLPTAVPLMPSIGWMEKYHFSWTEPQP